MTRSYQADKSLSVPQELQRAINRELDEQTKRLNVLLDAWPFHQRRIAYELLGSAVGYVDMLGGDAEGFLTYLRSVEPIPEPLPELVKSS